MQCNAVYRKLGASGVKYDIVNLPDFPDKVAEFKAAGFMQAPVVVAEGVDTFAGFNPGLVAEVVLRHGLGK